MNKDQEQHSESSGKDKPRQATEKAADKGKSGKDDTVLADINGDAKKKKK